MRYSVSVKSIKMTNNIVHNLRLPMALMALVVGATLAVGGAEIQTLLNNPMASPYTLGLAAAAGFGASIVIAFGSFGLPVQVAVPIGAFVMTMLASGILSCSRLNVVLILKCSYWWDCIALHFPILTLISTIYFGSRSLAANSVLAIW